MRWAVLCALLWVSAVVWAAPPAFITPHDTIPLAVPSPTRQSVQDGPWEDAATWGGAVPGLEDRVSVRHAVTFTNAQATAIAVEQGGSLACVTDAPVRLLVATVQVFGTLACQTAQPVEVIFWDAPLAPDDPGQYSNGLLILGGHVEIAGRPKTAFLRLAVIPKAGDRTLTFADAPQGWQPGDTLVLPDSRQRRDGETSPSQLETALVASVEGQTVRLATVLQYAHPGEVNADGVVDMMPHAFNTTRNIILRSENPQGIRGHFLATGQATVRLQAFSMVGMGRTTTDPLDDVTNRKGRYAGFHAHMMDDIPTVSPRFLVEGMVVDGQSPRYKWGMVTHSTRRGLIRGNIIMNVGGAGLVVEDEAAQDNVMEDNAILNVAGTATCGGIRADKCLPGREGAGAWAMGTANTYRRNVVANVAAYGYVFYRGGPFQAFVDNECYASRNCLTMWEINGAGSGNPNKTAPRSTIDHLVCWHPQDYCLGLGYPVYNVTFNRLVGRGDVTKMTQSTPQGFFWGDYNMLDGQVLNPDIAGMAIGIAVPKRHTGAFLIEGGRIQAYTGVMNQTMAAEGGLYNEPLGAKTVRIRNVRWQPVPKVRFIGNDGKPIPQRKVVLRFDYTNDNADVLQRDETWYEEDGQVSRLYYLEQAPDAVVPVSDKAHGKHGAPVAGLTNAQLWAQYGQAIAGAVAPCTTTTPLIGGFVCPVEIPALLDGVTTIIFTSR